MLILQPHMIMFHLWFFFKAINLISFESIKAWISQCFSELICTAQLFFCQTGGKKIDYHLECIYNWFNGLLWSEKTERVTFFGIGLMKNLKWCCWCVKNASFSKVQDIKRCVLIKFDCIFKVDFYYSHVHIDCLKKSRQKNLSFFTAIYYKDISFLYFKRLSQSLDFKFEKFGFQ